MKFYAQKVFWWIVFFLPAVFVGLLSCQSGASLAQKGTEKSARDTLVVAVYEENGGIVDRFGAAETKQDSGEKLLNENPERASSEKVNSPRANVGDGDGDVEAKLSLEQRVALKEQFSLPPDDLRGERQLVQLGLVHLEEGNLAEALHLMRRAWNSVVENHAKNFDVDLGSKPIRDYALSYAKVLLQTSERNEGRRILELLVEANPDWIEPLQFLFDSYLESRAFVLAERAARAAIGVSGGKSSRGYLNLLRALRAQGKTAEALKNLKYAQTLFPNSSEVNSWHGVFLYAAGFLTAACEKFAAAQIMNPLGESAAYNHGICLLSEGKLESALLAVDLALAATPGSSPLRFLRGELKVRQGQIGDARKDWSEFLQIADPSDARVYYVKNTLEKSE